MRCSISSFFIRKGLLEGCGFMEIAFGLLGVVIAVVAVGVAVWQGRMSKDQLEMSKEQLGLARDSEGRTERALEEIRTLSRENRDLAAGVKSDIDGRINKFLDQQLDRMRQESASKDRDDQMSSEFTKQFMEQMFGGTGFGGQTDDKGDS